MPKRNKPRFPDSLFEKAIDIASPEQWEQLKKDMDEGLSPEVQEFLAWFESDPEAVQQYVDEWKQKRRRKKPD